MGGKPRPIRADKTMTATGYIHKSERTVKAVMDATKVNIDPRDLLAPDWQDVVDSTHRDDKRQTRRVRMTITIEMEEV